MVSNEEISQRLRDRREGKSLNGYLVCNNCGSYYELQSGESWKDFDTECECGGQLVQTTTDTLYTEYENDRSKYVVHILLSYFLIWFFWPFAAMGAYYLLTRDNERANFHGKIITVICLFFFLITVYILFIFVYMGFMR